MTVKQFELFIDGKIRPAGKKEYYGCINPATGEVFAKVACATKNDMREAITAARRAFDNGSWSDLSFKERGSYLTKIAQLIRENAKELADLESLDTGKTIKQATFIDVPTAADTFEYFANISGQLQGKVNSVSDPVKSFTEYEPRGVVGCIVPWNYPLIMTAWKIAPALIAGNTVVFKPSYLGSVSLMRLAEFIEQIRLPTGVVNFISSKSNDVAAELVKSPDVNMISFSGGTQTGREIMRLAADTTKKLTLELGGKSPTIVFADADLETAAGGTMSAIFMNQGQMCTAGSRLLLEDKIYDKFMKILIEKTKNLKVGLPQNYETDFGPVISQEKRDEIIEKIKQAVSQGATVACGGGIPRKMKEGFYLEPTILENVKNSMVIAQEEIFGPVLSVMKFSTVEEAVRIANDTKYGLAASVWTKDLNKANCLARKLQCGTVWINTYGGFYNEVSFGGYKQSGFGRELGLEGLLEYMQSKHVCIDQTPSGKPLVASWF